MSHADQARAPQEALLSGGSHPVGLPPENLEERKRRRSRREPGLSFWAETTPFCSLASQRRRKPRGWGVVRLVLSIAFRAVEVV
jgi:hypothetical protein